MAQHYTRNTISAAAFCNKCNKETQHRVTDRRLAHCLECYKKLDDKHEELKAQPVAATQRPLF